MDDLFTAILNIFNGINSQRKEGQPPPTPRQSLIVNIFAVLLAIIAVGGVLYLILTPNRF